MHPRRIVEEVDADAGVQRPSVAMQVQGLGLVADRLGVDDPRPLAGLAQQQREILDRQVLLPRHGRAQDHHLEGTSIPRASSPIARR